MDTTSGNSGRRSRWEAASGRISTRVLVRIDGQIDEIVLSSLHHLGDTFDRRSVGGWLGVAGRRRGRSSSRFEDFAIGSVPPFSILRLYYNISNTGTTTHFTRYPSPRTIGIQHDDFSGRVAIGSVAAERRWGKCGRDGRGGAVVGGGAGNDGLGESLLIRRGKLFVDAVDGAVGRKRRQRRRREGER